MNIYLKCLPIIQLLEKSIMMDIMNTYKFDVPLEEHVTEMVSSKVTTFKIKMSIPVIDDVLSECDEYSSEYISDLIETFSKYHLSLDSGVRRIDSIAFHNFIMRFINDYNANISRLADINGDTFKSLAWNFSTDNNLDIVVKGVLKIYINDLLSRNDNDKGFFLDFLKRWRYRESCFYKLEPLFLEDDWDSIAYDFLFNFDQYKAVIYRYYYEFYIRSNDPKFSIAKKLLDFSDRTDYMDEADIAILINNLRDISVDDISDDNDDNVEAIDINATADYDADTDVGFDFTYNGVKSRNYEDYTLRLYFGKPLEHQLEAIDSFKNNMDIHISMMYKNLIDSASKDSTDFTSKIRFDYLRDNQGKIVERENIVKIFKRWDRYLDVYDMRKRNLTWGQIVSEIHKKSKYGNKQKTVPDIRKDYKEAERLIQSASDLSFPY